MSLKQLIALQNKGKTNEAPRNHGTDGAQVPVVDDSRSPDDGTESSAVPSGEAPAPDPGVSAEAPKRAGLGLNLIGAGRAVGGGRGAGTPKRVPVVPVGERVSDTDSGSLDSPEFSLEDLAGFEATDETAPARPTLEPSGFDDEIEATAPDRPVDPSLSKQQLSFIESLDGIYPVLHDPEMFGQAVRIVMLELQDHPEYKPLLADQDVHTMIRGMRSTMGLARIRKQEKSRKTGTKGKTAARGKSAVSDEDMALLDAVMGGFDE